VVCLSPLPGGGPWSVRPWLLALAAGGCVPPAAPSLAPSSSLASPTVAPLSVSPPAGLFGAVAPWPCAVAPPVARSSGRCRSRSPGPGSAALVLALALVVSVARCGGCPVVRLPSPLLSVLSGYRRVLWRLPSWARVPVRRFVVWLGEFALVSSLAAVGLLLLLWVGPWLLSALGGA